MKLSICLLFVMVVAVSSQKKLLGADDVDKKAAQALDQHPETPKTLKDIKRLAKGDRIEIKRMQSKVKQIKENLHNKDTPKSEKQNLKKEFRDLKKNLHSKKNELLHLKQEMKEMKAQKVKGVSGKKSKTQAAKDSFMMIGQEEKAINTLPMTKFTAKPTKAITTTTETTTTTTTTTVPTTTTESLSKKESRKKAQRKAERKAMKKNRKNFNNMQADAPAPEVKLSPFKLSRGRKMKQKCSSDSDCLNGAKCLTNKHGHKKCKGAGQKVAGKKCHSSNQCMIGLECFVTKTAEQLSHKKHKRRGKGICADPATTDASKGTFLPRKA